jgi:hypothetical protein
LLGSGRAVSLVDYMQTIRQESIQLLQMVRKGAYKFARSLFTLRPLWAIRIEPTDSVFSTVAPKLAVSTDWRGQAKDVG